MEENTKNQIRVILYKQELLREQQKQVLNDLRRYTSDSIDLLYSQKLLEDEIYSILAKGDSQ